MMHGVQRGVALTRTRPPFGADRGLLYRQAARTWLLALGATAGVAIAYFLAARLGLALLTEGVAVFWPAAGIAVGILVTFGRRARAAVVIAVVAATIAANVTGDRSIWTSVFKGLSNAVDAVLTAWLIETWFGGAFAFDDVKHVLGFVAAAGLGAAASAIAGAATVTLSHAPWSFWEVWRAWFLGDGVGTVVVAPLVIGLGQLWRELPSRADSIEGVGVLAVFMPVNIYSAAQLSGGWATYDADAVVFPLLLWLTARCHPIFAIVAAFIWSITVIWATIFGIGQFGDASVPLSERVEGAQISVTIVTFCTLILS